MARSCGSRCAAAVGCLWRVVAVLVVTVLAPCPVEGGRGEQSQARWGDLYRRPTSYVAGVRDGAWHYPEPYDGVRLIGDHLAFHGEGLDVRVAGEVIETAMPPRS